MSAHKSISFVKSGIRFSGYFIGMFAAVGSRATLPMAMHNLLFDAFWVLVVSEIIGVLEEVGEK